MYFSRVGDADAFPLQPALVHIGLESARGWKQKTTNNFEKKSRGGSCKSRQNVVRNYEFGREWEPMVVRIRRIR
jgi:hypothetical protein